MRWKLFKSKKERKPKEFSKIMAVVSIAMWIFVNLFALAVVIFTLDTSPLMYVIPSVDAVVAVVCGYYFWKAKAENQIKLKRLYGVDVRPYDEMFDEDEEFLPCDYKPPLYENSNIV